MTEGGGTQPPLFLPALVGCCSYAAPSILHAHLPCMPKAFALSPGPATTPFTSPDPLPLADDACAPHTTDMAAWAALASVSSTRSSTRCSSPHKACLVVFCLLPLCCCPTGGPVLPCRPHHPLRHRRCALARARGQRPHRAAGARPGCPPSLPSLLFLRVQDAPNAWYGRGGRVV